MADSQSKSQVRTRAKKSPQAFRTISEVAAELDVPQHVLRFWETKFSQIKPMKRGGGRRYYRPEDLDLLTGIKQLLYNEGYTIKGVQKLFGELGAKAIVQAGKAPKPGPKTAILAEDLGASDAFSGRYSVGSAEVVGDPLNEGATAGNANAANQGLSSTQKRTVEGMIDELQALRVQFAKVLGE